MTRIGFAVAGALVCLALAACGKQSPPEPVATASGQAAGIELEAVFGETEFDKPVGLEHREGYPELVYIIEQPGRIVSRSLEHPEEPTRLVLDITERVHDKGGEQGLLGLAFNPERSEEAYVNYTTASHTVIARYKADPANPDTLDPGSEQVLLTIAQPYSNHNGGQLAFGPDGYLYIATGDGGSGGDPQNNSQNLESLLGKILRIDVSEEKDGRPYAIPADNPFLEGGQPEIYAYGLRNPWRFSFDEETGKLWAADVGQDRFEEINLIESGRNYGWRLREGAECYNPKTGCEREGLTDPLFAYGRSEGVSVTGGFVYRGTRMPDWSGWYIYGDYGSGTIWALRQRDDGTAEHRTLLHSERNLTSFGRDAEGNLYVCTAEGRIYKLRQPQGT
ncbi:PQQ-dependent sugar dehydrogenase [Cohnella boryungensis]|uniref:PQQ-dependent sugar dehydrogenase n=1 Tax=Cohnella boryungensis TaxID=768479 RepID=A0ABV8S3I1_9BACL